MQLSPGFTEADTIFIVVAAVLKNTAPVPRYDVGGRKGSPVICERLEPCDETEVISKKHSIVTNLPIFVYFPAFEPP
jgi:hypothetical protein